MSWIIAREFYYGWDYTEFNDKGNPVFYDKKEDAQKSLDKYIHSTNDAHKRGLMLEPYQDDCEVMETGDERLSS